MARKTKVVFFFFFFLYKWKENPGEAAPPLPPECDALPLLQFLSHCFRLWSRDRPADSPGSNPGGVCVTPFYLYKKKKNDGLKNVLRKKKMYFFINKVFKTTLVASRHSGAGPFPTAVVGGGQGTAGLRLEPQSKEGSPHPTPRVLWFWDRDSYPEGPPTQARGAPRANMRVPPGSSPQLTGCC